MADKDDLLAELIFKKHLERSLARQNKEHKQLSKQLEKTCPVCEWAESDCTCKQSAIIPDAKSKSTPIIGSPSWLDKLGRDKRNKHSPAKQSFISRHDLIEAGATCNFDWTAYHILYTSNIVFLSNGPILLFNLCFGNIPIWPLENRIHINIKNIFEINECINCGQVIRFSATNLDGHNSHTLFTQINGVTID